MSRLGSSDGQDSVGLLGPIGTDRRYEPRAEGISSNIGDGQDRGGEGREYRSAKSGARPGMRVTHIAATLAFVAALGFVVQRWLFPPTPIQAVADVPEVSLDAPIAGRLTAHVWVGQRVEAGMLVGTVFFSEADEDSRNRLLETFRNEIDLLEKQRDDARTRVQEWRRNRAERIRTTECVEVARVAFESAKEGAGTDHRPSVRLVEYAGDLATTLCARTTELFRRNLASSAEVTEGQIREAMSRLATDTISRAARRVSNIELAERILNDALGNAGVTLAEIPDAEEFQDKRLISQLTAEIESKRGHVQSLERAPDRYEVRARQGGRVVRIAAGTHVSAGEPIAVVTAPDEARFSVRVPYEGEVACVTREPIRFRVARTRAEGRATVVSVRRGITERDRRLNEVQLIELIAVPEHPLSDIVPGERIEIVR